MDSSKPQIVTTRHPAQKRSRDNKSPVAGEHMAWIQPWIEEWGDTLARFVLWHTHDRELAQDIAQETFWRLHQWHERHPHNPVSGGWLFATARRIMIDGHRKKRVMADGRCVDEAIDGDPLMEQRVVQRLAVEDVLTHLAPIDRECLWLFYYQSLSVAEIAPILRLSETGVRTRLHRARRRFAQVWKENQDEPLA